MLGKFVHEVTSQLTPQDLADWHAYQNIKRQLNKTRNKSSKHSKGAKRR